MIKKSRNISADFFDIWDNEFPTERSIYKMERVCRVCGSRLLNKDGKYSSKRRHCSDHANWYNFGEYYWNAVRDQFLDHNQGLHAVEILLTLVDRLYDGVKVPSSQVMSFAKCELCGDIALCEIHHKIPVHTLDPTNIKLIWDTNNLICLCRKCHNAQDHHFGLSPEEKLRRIAKKQQLSVEAFEKQYRKLDIFMGELK